MSGGITPQATAAATLGFVHRFVPAAPATAGTEARTLLLLHGTGGNENDLLDLGRLLLPGAALLSPRGKVSERGAARFFRRLAEGVFDKEDLRVRTDELADFVAAASNAYGFDVTKVVAVGYSNGANIAASVLLRLPSVLAGAVLLHPMVPFTPEVLPDLAGVPVFIGAGRRDPLVPSKNTETLVSLLRDAGASVAVHWEANGGHELSRAEVDAARGWLG